MRGFAAIRCERGYRYVRSHPPLFGSRLAVLAVRSVGDDGSGSAGNLDAHVLLATRERALEKFVAADNLVDQGFVVDFEQIALRTRAKACGLDRLLLRPIAAPPSSPPCGRLSA
jgi:hypothetical protein